MKKFMLTLAALAFTTQAHAFWRVTWTDNSANEEGFKIERKVGNEAYATAGQVAAGVTTWDDASSVNNVVYCYKVTAFNAAAQNTGPEACTVAGTAPDAPSGPSMQWVP